MMFLGAYSKILLPCRKNKGESDLEKRLEEKPKKLEIKCGKSVLARTIDWNSWMKNRNIYIPTNEQVQMAKEKGLKKIPANWRK